MDSRVNGRLSKKLNRFARSVLEVEHLVDPCNGEYQKVSGNLQATRL